MTAPGIEQLKSSDYQKKGSASGTDVLRLNEDLSVGKFPVGIFREESSINQGAVITSVLGLGTNSTLLRTLAIAGNIASKTWSYFQGWRGAETEHQMDGHLILGGYDKAKIIGTNVTLPMQWEPACGSGFVVSITDIVLNLKNGSNPSILGSSQGAAIKACVLPENDYISLPYDVWDAFRNTTENEETGRSFASVGYYTMLVAANGA